MIKKIIKGYFNGKEEALSRFLFVIEILLIGLIAGSIIFIISCF